MEIIEKQVEKVKEVPYDGYGYCPRDRYATKGVAGTGLGLGIAGTALGLLALSRGGFGLFGNGASGLSMPENVNINALGGWFKDADSKSENKVVEYFREH